MIIFVSEHPVGLLRMSWEGLYVALSRVKYRDHIRLAIKRDDYDTLQYMEKLNKNKFTDWFFCGFKECPSGHGTMVWDRNLACEVAQFGKKPGFATNRSIARKKARRGK